MREMYTARLERKILLAPECYHFEFLFTGAAPGSLSAGQFLSLLADDRAGKTYTRAYSLASSPLIDSNGAAQRFDLCVNRVDGGFFSNHLCDMREGDTVRCTGPHGLFTLRQPPADGLLIAAGTGIAPMRGFAQWLFPEVGSERSAGRQYWLVYQAPERSLLFYDSYFRSLAAAHTNFHYLPLIGVDDDQQALQHALDQKLSRIAASPASSHPAADAAGSSMGEPASFGCYAYICGLKEIVKAARTSLAGQGWHKRQILFERYD